MLLQCDFIAHLNLTSKNSSVAYQQNESRETTMDAEKEKKNSVSSLSSDLIHKAFSFTDEEWNSIKHQETEEVLFLLKKKLKFILFIALLF